MQRPGRPRRGAGLCRGLPKLTTQKSSAWRHYRPLCPAGDKNPRGAAVATQHSAVNNMANRLAKLLVVVQRTQSSMGENYSAHARVGKAEAVNYRTPGGA